MTCDICGSPIERKKESRSGGHRCDNQRCISEFAHLYGVLAAVRNGKRKPPRRAYYLEKALENRA